MVEINITYDGSLRCRAIHEPSHSSLTTDAPRDNEGLGESFSPTDLVATALGTCMVTIMGIYAKRHDLDLEGTRVLVVKHMNTNPRRIGELPVTIDIPRSFDARHREAFKLAADSCPVHASLHPDIKSPVTINFAS